MLLYSSTSIPSAYYLSTFGNWVFNTRRKLISLSPTRHGCRAARDLQKPWAKNASVWDANMAYIGHTGTAAGTLWPCLSCTAWNCFPVVSGSQCIAILLSVYKQLPPNVRSERQPHLPSCILPAAQSSWQTGWEGQRGIVRRGSPWSSLSSEQSTKAEFKAAVRGSKSALKVPWLVLGNSAAAELPPSWLQHNLRTGNRKVFMWPDWRKLSWLFKNTEAEIIVR